MKANLKKTICFSFLILLAGFNLQAQNVISYFTDMPGYLLPSLESSHKLELIENYQKTGKDTLENLFGGKVRMLELDTVSQHISISTTSVSRFEMQIIENENDTLIAVINTVCAPVCSSYIKFYDTEWQEVKVDFPKYTNKSWYKIPISNVAEKNIETVMKTSFVELIFDQAEKMIVAKNKSWEYLNDDDLAAITENMTLENIKVPYSTLVREK